MRQKNITTIVADNRLTADTIARAIGANGRHDGYYLGNGYAVTWTNGNIIEATFRTGESFITSSNMDARLMYAHHFDFAMRDYDSLVGYKKSKQDTRQLDTIRSLWEMSHTVVNAMYPSFEGELQFLNLYWFLRRPVKVRRAWIPVMTNDVIRHAVKHGPADRREHEDWLQGEIVSFFLERFTDAMKALASMPEEEIMEAFTEEELCGIKDGLQNMADAFGTAAPECEPAPEVSEDGRHIHDGNIHIEIVDNPNFMNTALLVAYAQSELGFDEAKTKRVALTLYAKKLISFPLVIQNSIPFGVWKKMRHNMRMLRYNRKWGQGVKTGRLPMHTLFRDGESVYNGFGIVTTGLHPTDLTRDEERLYNLIVRSVIGAFKPEKNRKKRKNGRRNRAKTRKIA